MKDKKHTGPIAWMTKNSVAANLLMGLLVVGGVVVGSQIKQEVFPEFDLDYVTVGVGYPGASPAEVETGITLALEEELRGLDGVKRLTSSSGEGGSGVTIELELGVNPSKALADTKSAIDRITSFPLDAEEPIVSMLSNRQQVIQVVISGDQDEESLRQLAEQAREALLLSPDITYVDLAGVRPREIAIEVSQDDLRRYGLTLSQIAREIAGASVELPGGGIKTTAGEILVRTAERRNLGQEFADIPLVASTEGTSLRLGDIATVNDGFEDNDQTSTFNGKRAVMVNVFRSGDQTPIEIADEVYAYIERVRPQLPPGVSMDALNDRAQAYRERVDLLARNAQLGLFLVLIVLALFLNTRLAFWVTMGIPISFLGSFLMMPVMDVSFNMISLFAFIITLGIVVDDAIVVGENIHEMRSQGIPLSEAAVAGAKSIAMPVVFSVLTTVMAFLPMFLVPGVSGKFFRNIPAIVVSVLIISLVESLYVLPAHLGHDGILARIISIVFGVKYERARAAVDRMIYRIEAPRRLFSGWLHGFIQNRYTPVLRHALEYRGLTLATAGAILIFSFGFIASGRIDFSFMPKVDGDVVTAKAVLPFGVPVSASASVTERIVQAAHEVIAENGGDEISKGIFTQVGANVTTGGGPVAAPSKVGTHLGNAQVFLVPSDQRPITASQFADKWRAKLTNIAGLESLGFAYSTGPGSGADVEVQLSHTDLPTLEAAAAELARKLETYDGVKDIDDGFSAGKPQLDFKLTPEGRALGLTATEIGRQVRASFFGAEALRQQRGRDEVRVMVRLPKSERSSEQAVERLLIRTPDGGEVPLMTVASVHRGIAYTTIKRADGRRVVTVTAETIPGVANARKIAASLTKDVMPEIKANYAGLSYGFEGNQRREGESLSALRSGYLVIMLVIFGLLAIPFRSYVQPIAVMVAIPFGVVGALIGHLIMGFDMSLISVMGIVAVSGIVVNDSLVLVHAANEARRAGHDAKTAVEMAGKRRFRPILLTSLTTFFGLMPMILEPSVQARFLIPMAISLGFGVLFATFIILLLVPAVYLLLDDALLLFFGRNPNVAVLVPTGAAMPASPQAPER